MAKATTTGSRHIKSKSHTSNDRPLAFSDMLGFAVPHDRAIRKFQHQSAHQPQILRGKKGQWLDKRHSVEDIFKISPSYCKTENIKCRSALSPKKRIKDGDIKNLIPRFQDIRISSPCPHSSVSSRTTRTWYKKTSKKRNRVTCNSIVRVIKPICMKNNREEMEIYYEKLKG